MHSLNINAHGITLLLNIIIMTHVILQTCATHQAYAIPQTSK